MHVRQAAHNPTSVLSLSSSLALSNAASWMYIIGTLHTHFLRACPQHGHCSRRRHEASLNPRECLPLLKVELLHGKSSLRIRLAGADVGASVAWKPRAGSRSRQYNLVRGAFQPPADRGPLPSMSGRSWGCCSADTITWDLYRCVRLSG